MAETFFRVRKGLTVANSSASANLDPIRLTIGDLTANSLGVYANTVNAASFSVGTSLTANSTLVNAAAVNITGRVNTATFYATTSANVGANVQLTTSGVSIGNSVANVVANSILVQIANATSTANITPLALTIGTSTVNSTAIAAGANVVVGVSDIKIGNASVNVVINSSAISVSGYNVALLGVEDQTVTGGAWVTEKNLGTVSSGTVTPDPGDRPIQKYTNNGAHTLAPSGSKGTYWLDITNGASAGTITTSGWTKVTGDAFTTTNGHKFSCVCKITDLGSLLVVQAMQ